MRKAPTDGSTVHDIGHQGRTEVVPSETSQGTDKAPANGEGLPSDSFVLRDDPEATAWSKSDVVAGAGFEPATSGL